MHVLDVRARFVATLAHLKDRSHNIADHLDCCWCFFDVFVLALVVVVVPCYLLVVVFVFVGVVVCVVGVALVVVALVHGVFLVVVALVVGAWCAGTAWSDAITFEPSIANDR